MTIASLIEDLIKAGTAPALVGRVVQAIAEAAVPPADEERATKGAIRTRRWRDRKASQNVTERHGDVTGDASPKASQTVTDRHEAIPEALVRLGSARIYVACLSGGPLDLCPDRDAGRRAGSHDGNPRDQGARRPSRRSPAMIFTGRSGRIGCQAAQQG